MILNILYCFDNNYNFQAFTSMASLLDSSSQKLNFFIIHKSKHNDNFIPSYIRMHKNLNKIEIKTFNIETSFPNVKRSHVSEATYYRFYFDKIFKIKSDHLIYLDSDIICKRDPSKIFIESINNIKKSNYIIGAKTENIRSENNKVFFERINLNSNKYFNAGVIIIDTEKWVNMFISEKIINKLKINKLKLSFWDQDLLNMFFDGNYLEIDENLNFKVFLNKHYKKQNIESAMLLHFTGKEKPWNQKGIFSEYSKLYQNNFRKISNKKFHINHTSKIDAIKKLVLSIKNKTFFLIDHKFVFLNQYFKSFLA